MWNSKETFPKCIFQFTSMPQFTFSPTTFIPKAYFYKNKPKGLKVTKEDPRLIGSMRGFCDKYIHIFFSISTSFSLYPHLFEYIHIPHYYIHIFSSIFTSVVAILESLSRLKTTECINILSQMSTFRPFTHDGDYNVVIISDNVETGC